MSEQAQYNINTIIVLESHFKREGTISFEKEIANNLTIENKAQKAEFAGNENIILTVELLATYSAKIEETEVYNASVRIVGIFEKTGQGGLDEETFGKVNAPAILYPFVREHIANLFLRGGVGQIFLQPVNFYKRDDEK